jgi:hypothetical protein
MSWGSIAIGSTQCDPFDGHLHRSIYTLQRIGDHAPALSAIERSAMHPQEPNFVSLTAEAQSATLSSWDSKKEI